MKDKVEYMIIKKNIGWFKLAHLLLLLEGDFHEELRISGEGKLSEDVLKDYTTLQKYLEIKDIIQLLTTRRHQQIQTHIMI